MDSLYRIELFGGLKIIQPDRTISRFKTTKNGSMLALLASNRGRTQFREALMERFWPDMDIESARNSFRVALNSLRKQLEPPGISPNSVLVSDRLHVSLNPEAFWTDVEEFEGLLRDEQRAETDADRRTILRSATTIYCGDFMDGWHDDWILAERTRLTDMYLGALRRLLRLEAEVQDYDRAIECARKGASADPLREEWHRSLMRLYRAQGRQAAALQHYKDLKEMLWEQLGTAPSATTTDLARQCAEGLSRLPDRHPSSFDSFAEVAPRHTAGIERVPVCVSKQVGYVPAILTRFFGRTSEMQQIAALLSTPSSKQANTFRLVTLSGISGSGKTRLAVETGMRLRSVFNNRVWFVGVEDARSADQIVEMIARSIEIHATPAHPLLDLIAEALSTSHSLLILDNLEQVAEGASGVVNTLLSSVQNLTVLVTTQIRLGLAYEREFPVQTLSVPLNTDDLSELLETPVVALFVDRAQAARPDFALTQRNAPAIVQLCEKLDCLPLAVELAAAWAQVFTPAQMLDRLSNRFALLVSTRRGGNDRRRALRTAIDWSYSLLTEDQQRFLAKLRVFSGSWSSRAVRQICGEPESEILLNDLRRHSLISCFETEEDMRFSMLETIREYLKDALSDVDTSETESRHQDYYFGLSIQLGDELASSAGSEVAMRLDLEYSNIRTAISRRAQLGGSGAMYAACASLWRYWYLRGMYEDGIQWIRAALSSGQEAPYITRIGLLIGAARLHMATGKSLEANVYSNSAIAVARENNDPVQIMKIQCTIILGGRDMRGAQAMIEAGREAAAYALALQDRPGAALLCSRTADLCLERGDAALARDCLLTESKLRLALNDNHGYRDAMSSLARAERMLGNTEAAKLAEAASMNLGNMCADSNLLARSYYVLGLLSLLLGDLSDAHNLLDQSRLCLGVHTAADEAGIIRESILHLYLAQDDLPATLAYLRSIAAGFSSARDHQGLIVCLRTGARLCFRCGRIQDALYLFGASLSDSDKNESLLMTMFPQFCEDSTTGGAGRWLKEVDYGRGASSADAVSRLFELAI